MNVSSRSGMWNNVKDESIKSRLKSNDLTIPELVQILENFVKLDHQYFYYLENLKLTVFNLNLGYHRPVKIRVSWAQRTACPRLA